MGERESGAVTGVGGFGRDEDFEWVNAWALQSESATLLHPLTACEAIPDNVHVLRAAFAADAVRAATELEAMDESAPGADQLRRDVLDIERARDALAKGRIAATSASPARNRWIPLRRTADSVPVILGSVLGVLMLVVFTAAATFVKLAR